MSEPRTITLTLRASVLAAIVVVLLLGLLGSQLFFIAEQRGIIDHQRDIATRQEARSAPVLDTANALLGSKGDARAAVAEVGGTLRELRAVLPGLRKALPRAPEIVAAVERTVDILGRTYPLLRDSLDVQRRTLTLTERSLAVQEEAVALQRALLGRSDTIIAVANETLVHARSLDNKTGGTAPPAVLP